MYDICLISQSHLCFNPRLVKEADTLTGAGYSVAVISPIYSEWGIKADQEFATRTWQLIDRPQFGPLSPRHLRLIELARRGIALSACRITDCRFKWAVNGAWHPVTVRLIGAALRVKAKLYIAHYPAALPAASRAAEKFNGVYAFDAEDFHPGDPPDGPAYDFVRKLTDRIERSYLLDARYVSAASPGIADAYRKAYSITRPKVILNVFPRENAPCAASDRGAAEPGPSVYWFSQTIGPDRGLENAVLALSLSKAKPHLYLRGNCDRRFAEKLERLALEQRVHDRLHFLPLAAPSEMERLASQYDLGLVAETGATLNRRIALTNKQFTFLLAGIPVILSDIPAHAEFAKEAGKAAKLFENGSPESLANAIDSFLYDDPDRLRAARKQAYTLGQERYNWEVESQKLRDLVAKAFV